MRGRAHSFTLAQVMFKKRPPGRRCRDPHRLGQAAMNLLQLFVHRIDLPARRDAVRDPARAYGPPPPVRRKPERRATSSTTALIARKVPAAGKQPPINWTTGNGQRINKWRRAFGRWRKPGLEHPAR